MEQLTD